MLFVMDDVLSSARRQKVRNLIPLVQRRLKATYAYFVGSWDLWGLDLIVLIISF